MRGLAFPPNAPGDREPSYEYGTPISNVDDIPIDPALGGPPIHPALIMEPHPINVVFPNSPQEDVQRDASWSPHPKLGPHPPFLPQENPYLHQQLHPLDDYQIRQYSQGPQGDPFAPQIPSPYFPIQEQPLPPPQPPKPKRKRKFLREEECSFCQGNETRNKAGKPESMVTCVECGRSGHPSCMSLETLGEVVRSYPWKCLECKNCEVCQEKGDDARILFCDWCDRGWHMDCVDPPFQDPPEGKWHCPICPPIPPEGEQYPPNSHFPDRHFSDQPQDTLQTPAADREPSVASSSRSGAVAEVKSKKNKKSMGRPKKRAPKPTPISDGSDNDDPVDIETMTPVATSTRARVRVPTTKSASMKGKARAASPDEAVVPTPSRTLKRKRQRDPSPAPSPAKVRLRIPAQRGRKGKEREEDEAPRGMFDDILTPEERSTSNTTPQNADKIMFERSRHIAESKLAPQPPPPPPTASSSRSTRDTNPNATETPVHTRPLRSSTLQQSTPKTLDFNFTHLNSPGPSTPGAGSSSSWPLQAAKFEPGVLRIRTIRFGPYDIKTWYDAPFPEEYASIPDGRLWICEFCLKYMKSRFKAIRHQMKCKSRHPPGDEIYRDGSVSIFEVDGRRNKIYCQNLCLLSKMFLDHKSLFYDVEPFLFYVITLVDDFGARFVGYFSKEKRCPKDYNLSCIMTLPVRQRQGWGNFLIDFSYLLSKIEQRQGSPEKPLSGLGALGYKNYWTLAVMRFLEKAPDNVRLEDISAATSMTVEDVCNTLMQQNMIYIREPTPPIIRPSPGQSIKFPKGRKNGVGRRQLQRLQSSHTPTHDGSPHSPTPKTNGHSNEHKGPFVAPKHYEIRFEREKVEVYLRKWESKGYMRLKPEKLQWTPYLVTRSTQEAPKVDLPAMDTVPVDTPAATESSVVVVVSEPPTEPVTPALGEEDKEMVVDTVEVPRARTRSSARSCSSPGRSVRTVEDAMSTRSGRLLTEPRTKKRRRIESSPEEEAVVNGVVKWEDKEPVLEDDEDADGEYDLDAEGEPDTEFVM